METQGMREQLTEQSGSLSRSVTIRVTAEQYEELERSAKTRSVKVSNIVRNRLFESEDQPMQSMDLDAVEALREYANELHRTRVEANRIGVSLNQIARKMNQGIVPQSDDLLERYSELAELWNEDRKLWRAAP